MGLFDFLSRSPPDASGDLAIDRIAARIAEKLRALGLHVRAKRYGAFHEIRASTSKKLITTPGDMTASGIALLIAPTYDPPQLVFEQINSLGGGLGARMVDAALSSLREHASVIAHVRVNDLSPIMTDGRRWWERLAARYADFDWRITHDEDGATHVVTPPEDIAQSSDFITQAAALHALTLSFGFDPGKVRLAPQKPPFDFLGQRFTSEGESFPDGRIVIYYDPAMSTARMGCCLAHEIQHVRYDVVRRAYQAEPANGPLHRRFAEYTPPLLAARRGVSDYSNEHWNAWKDATPPALFSMEIEQGGSEPINETIADVAKALYNWGPDVRIDPLWKELKRSIDEEYFKIADTGRPGRG